jgi:endonuclease III
MTKIERPTKQDQTGKPREELQEHMREKYRSVARILAELYGYPTWRQHHPPVDELVDCILSQRTSDTNRDRGFAALKAYYPNWEAVRDAPVEEVTRVIQPAGLSQIKAPRIQEVLRTITERQGSITLDFMTDMDVADAKAWLTSLNGIGPKTAAIVLLFAFGKPALPVDTHVHRVTQRLGFIGAKVTPDAAHDLLEAIIPPDEYYQAHLNIIEHGRKVCRAPRPRCEACPLTALCDYYNNARPAAKVKDARE